MRTNSKLRRYGFFSCLMCMDEKRDKLIILLSTRVQIPLLKKTRNGAPSVEGVFASIGEGKKAWVYKKRIDRFILNKRAAKYYNRLILLGAESLPNESLHLKNASLGKTHTRNLLVRYILLYVNDKLVLILWFNMSICVKQSCANPNPCHFLHPLHSIFSHKKKEEENMSLLIFFSSCSSSSSSPSSLFFFFPLGSSCVLLLLIHLFLLHLFCFFIFSCLFLAFCFFVLVSFCLTSFLTFLNPIWMIVGRKIVRVSNAHFYKSIKQSKSILTKKKKNA